MTKTRAHECTNCGEPVASEVRSYRYAESGLPSVVLQGVDVSDCPKCGESDVSIPRLAKIHRAIARALANSPVRLTGLELLFLRKHLGLNGEQLGQYLHTDKTKISKWETGKDRIGPATDRLIRLLVTALDEELRPQVGAVAAHLPQISDEPGRGWELHVDVGSLQTVFIAVPKAA